MCVMCKYCHWGGYMVLCHKALHVQVYLGDCCMSAMWQKGFQRDIIVAAG